MNLVTIGLDGRTTEPAYTISSPGAFGSGELKMQSNFYYLFSILNYKTKQEAEWRAINSGNHIARNHKRVDITCNIEEPQQMYHLGTGSTSLLGGIN